MSKYVESILAALRPHCDEDEQFTLESLDKLVKKMSEYRIPVFEDENGQYYMWQLRGVPGSKDSEQLKIYPDKLKTP